MKEPSPRGSRLALAGALVAALLVGGGGFLLGRATDRRVEIVTVPTAPPSPAKPEPLVRGALDRAELLALAAAAADVAAGGQDSGEQVASAEGRRFELRLPFGCDGPIEEGGSSSIGWRYDRKTGSLRVRAAPVLWSREDWWPADTRMDIEAIEGFWIARPWTSSEACPAKPGTPVEPGLTPTASPAPTLALGQLFTAEDSRTGRRKDQPYEAVIRVPEEGLDTSKGFRLRISGRIAAATSRDPVRCRRPQPPEQPPLCLISVVMDEVAIENPASGETIATWDLRGGEAGAD